MLFPCLIININCKVFSSVILSPINKQHIYWIDIMTGSIHTKGLQLMALRICCYHLFDILILFCFNAFASLVRTYIRVSDDEAIVFTWESCFYVRNSKHLANEWMNVVCSICKKSVSLVQKNIEKKNIYDSNKTLL